MNKGEEIGVIDTIVNLTGRRVTLAINGQRLDIEPAPKTASFDFADSRVGDFKYQTGESGNTITIPVERMDLPRVLGLPAPRKGVVYIVKREIALHPRVRRRADVFAPSNKDGLVSQGLIAGD